MFPTLRAAFLVAALGTTSAITLLATPALAQENTAAVVTHDDAMKTPVGKFVQDLGNNAIGVIADKSITKDQRDQKFRDILRNSFDLQTIGRFVIGRSWNSATPDQQKDYMQLFQDLVIKTYGGRMTLYTGEGFTVTGVRPESEKDTIVSSQITHPDGSDPTKIDWRIRTRDGKMGVIDVVVEGVSLSVTQRQEYAAVIQNNNGDIGALLDKMRQEIKAVDSQPQQ
jgi:phospholipid transport system substrate-binding protein